MIETLRSFLASLKDKLYAIWSGSPHMNSPVLQNVQTGESINIELEITLRCNSACPQCSRHCNVFSYGDSDMSLTQVQKFIRQVLAAPAKLGHITIMGGEPTVHPEFEEITQLLYKSLVQKNKVGYLEVATNGIKPIANSILNLPVRIRVSPPSSKYHRCQFIAPKDTNQETKICDVPSVCGFALNCYGYNPCGAGGAIIRLFNMKDLIRYELPLSLDEFKDVASLCALCQASAVHQKMYATDDSTPSASFQEAIRKYHERKPQFKYF